MEEIIQYLYSRLSVCESELDRHEYDGNHDGSIAYEAKIDELELAISFIKKHHQQ